MADALTRTQIDSLLSAELGIPLERIHPEHRLVEDLGCDSLDLVNLAIEVETLADRDISDDEADRWRTVTDIYRSAGLA